MARQERAAEGATKPVEARRRSQQQWLRPVDNVTRAGNKKWMVQ